MKIIRKFKSIFKISKQKRNMIVVVLVIAVSLHLAIPKTELKYNILGKEVAFKIGSESIDLRMFGADFYKELKLTKGLDLQGGLHLSYIADMNSIADDQKANALESLRNVIERRVNQFGVGESSIQTSQSGNEYKLLVDLPGIKDVNSAIELIGKVAHLEFREPNPEFFEALKNQENQQPNLELSPFLPTQLTGKELQKAIFDIDPQKFQPVVSLTFTEEGKKLFDEMTTRNVGKPIYIFLDDQILLAPNVSEPIKDGRSIINGLENEEEAKNIAIALNSGALPVPITMVEQRIIGPTLGVESIQASVAAGIVGLIIVVVFMLLNYGRNGIFSIIALFAYGVITFALYRILGITLTLSGIAGFILSVGMAVDSSILIFERLKEELRDKKTYSQALNLAFKRATTSIKDANINTLIICLVLFNPLNLAFLNDSGMIRGFALTLVMGVLIGLFTSFVIVKTLMIEFQPKESK